MAIWGASAASAQITCSCFVDRLQMRPRHTEGRSLVAEDLQALSCDFNPCFHLWSPLNFRFVLKYVFVFPFQLRSPKKYLPLKGLGWFFSKAQGRITSSFLFFILWRVSVPQLWALSCHSRLIVDRWRPGGRKELFSRHHCPQQRSWTTTALFQNSYTHFCFS